MRVITTDMKHKKYWEEKEYDEINLSEEEMELIYIYPDKKRQEIYGFGGAFTESSGYCYAQLSKEEKEKVLNWYFSEEGLQYNMGRTHINSCDFSLSNYCACDDKEDGDFKSFTLKREEQYIFPLIYDAMDKAGQKLPLLLSPWSPPAYMKTNHSMNGGGKLKENYYGRWAKYIAHYITEMKKREMNVRWLTVQNEPNATQVWDSCRYTVKEEATFIREFLGKELEKSNLSDIGIYVWDHNKERACKRLEEILEVKGTREYVKGVGVHWYSGDHFENIEMLRQYYPELDILFTEGCVEYSKFDKEDEVKNAELYAHDMIGNFKSGLNGFLDWNLLLDEQGGPNHVGNYCAAPIMCKKDWEGVERHLSYYYIGHFSRYVKQGARVIWLSKYTANIEGVAFLNPDGERVVVLLNQTEYSIKAKVGEEKRGTFVELAPHSIVTICWGAEK